MKAFPTEHAIAGTMDLKADGMDLRDYFAAKAMQAIMTNSNVYFPKISKLAENKNEAADLVMSQLAYVYADAMMKAREKK